MIGASFFGLLLEAPREHVDDKTPIRGRFRLLSRAKKAANAAAEKWEAKRRVMEGLERHKQAAKRKRSAVRFKVAGLPQLAGSGQFLVGESGRACRGGRSIG